MASQGEGTVRGGVHSMVARRCAARARCARRAQRMRVAPVGHARNVGKLGPGTPLDDNVDERVRAFVGVLLNLDRQACL
eukprot:850323-Prymnesium_polylepis.1